MATTGELRAKLNTQLSDQELVAFCTDHFPMVYNQFTAGMTQGQRIQLLLDYAVRRGQLDDLERLIEEFLRKRDELPDPPPPPPSQVWKPAPTNNSFVTLELGIHRGTADGYEVNIRLDDTSYPAVPVTFDLDTLQGLSNMMHDYGQTLSKSLFRDTVMAKLSVAQERAGNASLRLRLSISETLTELHNVRWEALRHPEQQYTISTSQNILFSRWLGGYRPPTNKVRTHRALVVVSNPTNLDGFKPGGVQLDPIDVAGEVARAKQGLAEYQLTILDSGGKATLDEIKQQHLQGSYDVLYIVAHGTVAKGQSWIWLEDKAGDAHQLPGQELVNHLSGLSQPPRLVVLVSCQSAGTGHEGALVALGPALAKAGIPYVLAMQGKVSMATMERFIPTFFQQVHAHDIVDRAVAEARGTVSDRPDWWMPVLFMSIRSGRLWGNPAATTGEITMDDEKIQHLKKELKRYEKISHELKMQKASFGLHTPPHITLGIEEAEEEIAKLKRQLDTSS